MDGLRTAGVVVCIQKPYHGPIPYPRNPTKCLQTRLINPKNVRFWAEYWFQLNRPET